MPKNFERESYCFWENCGFQKFLWMRAGGITFFRQKILVSQCRKFSWASLQCFRNFGVTKNFMHNRGISRFSIENLLCHSTEILRKGTLLCFTKFLVSKKFVDIRGGRRGGGGREHHDFVKNFLSHGAEKFHRGTLLCCVSQNFR